jgi:hypothetical protein
MEHNITVNTYTYKPSRPYYFKTEKRGEGVWLGLNSLTLEKPRRPEGIFAGHVFGCRITYIGMQVIGS